MALLSPNLLGLYDMHGNIAEWTFDMFKDQPDGGATPRDPLQLEGMGMGDDAVVRGGAFTKEAKHCRSARRDKGKFKDPHDDVGFRPVRTVFQR